MEVIVVFLLSEKLLLDIKKKKNQHFPGIVSVARDTMVNKIEKGTVFVEYSKVRVSLFLPNTHIYRGMSHRNKCMVQFI